MRFATRAVRRSNDLRNRNICPFSRETLAEAVAE